MVMLSVVFHELCQATSTQSYLSWESSWKVGSVSAIAMEQIWLQQKPWFCLKGTIGVPINM